MLISILVLYCVFFKHVIRFAQQTLDLWPFTIGLQTYYLITPANIVLFERHWVFPFVSICVALLLNSKHLVPTKGEMELPFVEVESNVFVRCLRQCFRRRVTRGGNNWLSDCVSFVVETGECHWLFHVNRKSLSFPIENMREQFRASIQLLI